MIRPGTEFQIIPRCHPRCSSNKEPLSSPANVGNTCGPQPDLSGSNRQLRSVAQLRLSQPGFQSVTRSLLDALERGLHQRFFAVWIFLWSDYTLLHFPVNGHFIQNPCPIFGCTRGNFMLDWHKGGGRAPGPGSFGVRFFMMLNWNELEAQCLSCQKCALADKRTNVVFGVGPGTPRSCSSARARARTRTFRASPFVGRGPAAGRDAGAHRPEPEEKRVHRQHHQMPSAPQPGPPELGAGRLHRLSRNQVALIRPKIIVCLGRIAAIRLIKEDFKITKEHGQWFEKSGVQMMALFHPRRHPPGPPAQARDL